MKNRVRYWREKRGLLQKVLAAQVGVSDVTIQNIEAGRRGFTSQTLERLSQALDVPPAQLLDLAEMKEREPAGGGSDIFKDQAELKRFGEFIARLARLQELHPERVERALHLARQLFLQNHTS